MNNSINSQINHKNSKYDIISNLQNEINDTELYSVNCKYYNSMDFNNINHLHSEFAIFHMNIRSLNANRQDLQAYLATLNKEFEFIALTEIGKTNIRENASYFKNYNFHYSESTTRSGGAGLFVKDTIKILHKRNDLNIMHETKDCTSYQTEDIWLECKLTTMNKPIIIGVIYRHPSGNVDSFNAEMERIIQAINKEDKVCVICGDFNINIMNKENESSRQFIEQMISENYIPHITCPTRITDQSATLIDNIFLLHTSNMIDIKITSGNLITDITDHLANFLIYGNTIPQATSRKQVRIYSEYNTKAFIEHLHKEETWKSFMQSTDCDDATERYLKITREAHEKYFPMKMISIKRDKDKKWITKGIRISCRKKMKLYRKYLKKPTEENQRQWKNYRNFLRGICKKAECEYFKKIISDTNGSIKRLWQKFRPILNVNKSNKSKSKIEKLQIDEKIITGDESIACAFNEYFCNIGKNLSKSIPKVNKIFSDFLPSSNCKSMFVNPFSENELLEEIAKLKDNKAIGYSDIPIKLFKKCKFVLVKPLVTLYNMTIEQGVFPNALKMAQVIPIHKGDEKHLAQNYRPISILNCISKLLERLMQKRLYKFLEKHDLMYPLQFGFRRKHSTNQALIEVTEKIKEALDSGQTSLGIYLDIKKAFDTVNHNIMLKKMYHYGIRGTVYNWFKSYLSHRTQYVKVNGCNSHIDTIQTGVPQGSVLGPLLYIMYVNDIGNCANDIEQCQIMLFADDTNVLLQGKDIRNLMKRSQSIMNTLEMWLCANKLSLNVKKTNYCIFHSPSYIIPKNCDFIKIGSKQIERVTYVKYLGLIIDDKLNWKLQSNELARNLVKTASTLKFIRNHIPYQCKKQLYYAYAYSKIIYGIEVYDNANKTNINKLQVLQNRILKILYNFKIYVQF